MANLSITAAQVLYVSGPVENGTAGEALTPGQAVYKSTSDGKWYMAQADGTALQAGSGTDLGLALNDADAANFPVRVALKGCRVTLGAGAAPAASAIYVLSATFGSIADAADIVTAGHFRTVIALGAGSNAVDVIGVAPGGAIPA